MGEGWLQSHVLLLMLLLVLMLVLLLFLLARGGPVLLRLVKEKEEEMLVTRWGQSWPPSRVLLMPAAPAWRLDRGVVRLVRV